MRRQHSVPPSLSRCYFLELPQEILDLIYELAYCSEIPGGVTAVFKHDGRWDSVQGWDKRLSCFMVCKNFFAGTVIPFIKAQKWMIRDTGMTKTMVPSTLFYENVQRVVLSSCVGLRRLRDCHRLTDVTIMLEYHDFADVPLGPGYGRRINSDRMTLAEFEGLRTTRALLELGGLHSLTLVAGAPRRFEFSPSLVTEKKMFLGNLKTLEEVVLPYVCRGKEMPQRAPRQQISIPESQPLYPGSMVCFGTNRLSAQAAVQ
ncbi:hypothetical protein LTR15_012876 [Elasticomyces elasticus]|nr:hypothetical protein LTR15_012876 [Elasticomyces elasticus]